MLDPDLRTKVGPDFIRAFQGNSVIKRPTELKIHRKAGLWTCGGSGSDPNSTSLWIRNHPDPGFGSRVKKLRKSSEKKITGTYGKNIFHER
jgi:hypothetical protein